MLAQVKEEWVDCVIFAGPLPQEFSQLGSKAIAQ